MKGMKKEHEILPLIRVKDGNTDEIYCGFYRLDKGFVVIQVEAIYSSEITTYETKEKFLWWTTIASHFKWVWHLDVDYKGKPKQWTIPAHRVHYISP